MRPFLRQLKQALYKRRFPVPEYLTEKNLGLILDELYPDNDFIHDKSVPNSKNKRRRPDYRSEERKLIIEFDGDSHYCKAQRIKSDIEKDEDYSSLGYRIFRIPYFVQISTPLLKKIFNENIPFIQRYPNGFIDPKAVLPSDFCELGIQLFKNDLVRFEYLAEEIVESLRNKAKEKNDIELVVPLSLKELIT
jgi:hypothetical protein